MACPLFSTPSLAELYKDPTLTEVAKSDWLRIRRFLAGSYPQPLTEIVEWTTSTEVVDDLRGAPWVAIDTEWVVDTGRMFTLGIGGPGTKIYQWWPQRHSAQEKCYVVDALTYIIGERPTWFQNCMADLPVIEANLGIHYGDYRNLHDTMLLFSVLWCELPKTLEFLDSLYGNHEKMKHLPSSDPRYNAGDIASTIAVALALTREAQRDPESYQVYVKELLPLVPIILEAQRVGIRVDRRATLEAKRILDGNRSTAITIGAGYAGYPLNLGSQGEKGQVAKFLSYDLGKRVKSIDDDSISDLRNEVLPFDPEEEMSIELLYERIAQGAHPILETRVLYARAQQYLSHYVEPMLESSDGRVYPEFHPWTQVTGRWSTVGFPAAQLPNLLRPSLLPDIGWLWFEFDWSNIELRLLANLANDPVLIEGFRKSWDLHTYHLCEAFGFPTPKSWIKSEFMEDSEWLSRMPANFEEWRVFIKRMVFRLCYGGEPNGAAGIPGAAALGLPASKLVSASKSWVNKHPEIRRYWRSLIASGLRSRSLRTVFGRKWNFLSHDLKRIQRQMYDFPMQGSVASIKNLVLVQIWNALTPRVRFSYEMHDSLKLQVKLGPDTITDCQTIIRIAEQPWPINGKGVRFPVEWKARGATNEFLQQLKEQL